MPNHTRLMPRGSHMSDQERRTLKLVARGFKASHIADSLGVTRSYVYSLIRMLRARFDANTNAEMISRAISEGLISPDVKWAETRDSTEKLAEPDLDERKKDGAESDEPEDAKIGPELDEHEKDTEE